MRAMVGAGGKAVVERVREFFSHGFQERLRRAGNIAYSLFIVGVAGAGMWFALALSNATTFSEIRPALHAALAPFSTLVRGGASADDTPMLTARGQITAMGEFDVTSPVSARVLRVRVRQGAVVAMNDVLVEFDDSDARRAIRAAELELANAKLELERAQSGTNPQAVATVRSAATVMLADVFANMPWVVTESGNILYGNDVEGDRINLNAYADMAPAHAETTRLRDAVATEYAEAEERYRKTKLLYETRVGAGTDEAILRETQTMLQAVVRALTSAEAFLAFIRNNHSGQSAPPILLEHVAGIAARKQTAADNLEAITNALDSLADAKAATESGVISIRDMQLRVSAAEIALTDAAALLGSYIVRAPRAGKISRLDVAGGQAVVQGQILAAIAAPQNVARVALTEAEVGKVRVGQAARVQFDAIDGLVITGEVIAVDGVATVANDTVVFYAYIGFVENELRPKPGMSITARINI